MSTCDSTPIRRAATSSTSTPATADLPPDDEVFWQQLMAFNYVLHEVIDAMERERTTCRRQPLNQSWLNFVYQLRIKKPKLGTCLDHWLRDGFFDELGGGQ